MEHAGFDIVFTSGYSLAASTLGMPDIGLLTASEVLDRVRNIATAVSIPVIADMDTGYGNPLNVVRTVRECVAAGVAGIILEDQEWPKKCGHMEGKRVIPREEHVQKIRAAVAARGDSGLVLIGRTDARAVVGLDDAIERGKAYRDAGADIVFVEAPQSLGGIADHRAGHPRRAAVRQHDRGRRHSRADSHRARRTGVQDGGLPALAALRRCGSRAGGGKAPQDDRHHCRQHAAPVRRLQRDRGRAGLARARAGIRDLTVLGEAAYRRLTPVRIRPAYGLPAPQGDEGALDSRIRGNDDLWVDCPLTRWAREPPPLARFSQ